jgi:hypothetical protein
MPTLPDTFVQPVLRLATAAILAVMMLAAVSRPVAAQTSAPAKPGNSATAKPAPASATKKSPADKPARAPAAQQMPQPAPREDKPSPEPAAEPTFSTSPRPFLTGDEWIDTVLRFEQWLTVQTLYDADQVKQMRAKFAQRVKSTPTADRRQFMDDTDAKLQTLYGSRALDLQNYFAESLSVASPAYVKKSRQQLPDVVLSTPEQLKEGLARIAAKHRSTVEVQQAFDQTRQMQIASHEAKSDPRRRGQSRPPAGHIASASPGTGRQSRSGYTQARDYYPKTNSSISYSIIPAMPMMTSSGFAMFGGGVAITIQRNR